MAKRVGVDKWLFGVVLLLVLFGLVMVFSASAVLAQSSMGSPYPFVVRQALWAVLGLLAMVALMQVDYRRYNNPKVVFPAVAVTMLMLIGVFAMSGMNGAQPKGPQMGEQQSSLYKPKSSMAVGALGAAHPVGGKPKSGDLAVGALADRSGGNR